MPNSIRIKRRLYGGPGGNTAPNLLNAELAFNENNDTLYYGWGTGGEPAPYGATGSLAIAGPGSFITRGTTQDVWGQKTFTADAFFTKDVTITQDININGGDIVTTSETFNIVNNNAFNVGFAKSANTIVIGATTGYTTIRNNLKVEKSFEIAGDTIFTGDLALNGGDLTSTSSTFNILPTSATINFGAEAVAVNIGASTGIATIKNPTVVGVNTTQNLWDTVATTVNAFGVASTLNVGANTGIITIRNPFVVGVNSTQDLWNTVATTVNAFGAASVINIGSSTGTTKINSNTVVGNNATQNLWNTVASTVNAFGVATALNLGASTGIATISNPTVVGVNTTQNLWNTVATSVNFAGAASAVSIGSTVGTTTINSNTVVGNNTTQNLWNTVATNVNAFGAATVITIGSDAVGSETTIRSASTNISGVLNITGVTAFSTDVIVGGDLTVNGTLTSINSSTITVDDKNLELGSVVSHVISTTGIVGSVTGGTSGTITGLTDTTELIVGSAITADDAEGSIGFDVVVASIVNKTSITITSSSGIMAGTVENITTGGATDVTADGGGFTLKGLTDKTFNWIRATDSWTSSENMTLASGKQFYIDSASVLNSTTLGGGVIYSSLTTVGNITTGVWNGTTILANKGGTGYDTYAIGDILWANSTTTLAKLPRGTGYQFLQMNAAGNAPEWVSVIDGGSF